MKLNMRLGIVVVLSALCGITLGDANATASEKATPLTTDGSNVTDRHATPVPDSRSGFPISTVSRFNGNLHHSSFVDEDIAEDTISSSPPSSAAPAVATTTAAAAAVTEAAPAEVVTVPLVPTKPPPVRRYPCSCGNGECGCCTGSILQNFNIPIRQRGCVNITYEPDDFTFKLKLLFNDRVLYRNTISAKNPRPVCVPINNFFGIKMCVRLSNVFLAGRNLHACVDLEGYFQDETAFDYSFNCFRIGNQGIAVVAPEDGGGLPAPPDAEEQTDEEYDDSARGWIGEVEAI